MTLIDVKKLISRVPFLCRFINQIRYRQRKSSPILLFFTDSYIQKWINFFNVQYPEISIRFLDIGARDGLIGVENFSLLRLLKNKTVHGIEPDTTEAKRLMQSKEYNQVFTDAVGASRQETLLQITKNSSRSSIYLPDLDVVKMIGWNSHEFETTNSVPIHLKTIGEIVGENTTYDFMKMDIQGCEYDALISMSEPLWNSLLCVHVETQRLPYLKGQQHAMGSIIRLMEQKHFFLRSVEPLYAPLWPAEDNLIFDNLVLILFSILLIVLS